MAQNNQQYPTGVNPELIKEGEFRDDGTMEDNDLQSKTNNEVYAAEHMDYIRKVLGIVAVQMAFTFLLCIISNLTGATIFKSIPLLILCLIGQITSMCVLFCYEERRRRVPENYIWLGIFTVCEAFFLACVAADITNASLYGAIFATCISVGALFLGALYAAENCDRDQLIKTMCKWMVIGIVVDIVVILLMLFVVSPKDKALIFVISLVMCAFSGMYVLWALLFVIVPGLESHDDYILGALRLYIEIARLFYWMMRLLGEKK